MLKTTRQCTYCKKIKDISEFTKNKSKKYGINNSCKKCDVIQHRIYHRTKKGLISNIFINQKKSSKKRGHTPPTYTKEELCDWVLSKENFIPLYDAWVSSNYRKLSRPSTDRIDDSKGYSFDNIRLVTWKENNDKELSKKSKVVKQYSMNGDLLNIFHSANEAERQTSIRQGQISRVCRGERPHTRGFRFEYA